MVDVMKCFNCPELLTEKYGVSSEKCADCAFDDAEKIRTTPETSPITDSGDNSGK